MSACSRFCAGSRSSARSRSSATRSLLPLEFTSPELGLALGAGIFALIERVCPPFQLRGRLGAVLNGDSSP
jgi:hypothetical protein